MEEEREEGKTPKRRLKVLVPIEESEISELVIKRSGQFAKATGCEITVLTVVEDIVHYPEFPHTELYQKRQEKADELLKRVKKVFDQYGIECQTRLAIGPIEEEIVRIAEEGGFDVIFLGSRGKGGLKRMLLGSVADTVIRHAHCSVAVIR
ncbi:MAG: universal stress protein [Deltaproteobacteria bacterium]|nr:universal stress protein [Deltaproteobacteria bacterium]